ncbi:hypothetical protein [Nocardioides sp. cx-173]|uniref:hypothetical protein n=1 Tax=Nocardioides sp. cx-173 TaxID=2898796 RepID=UPI001E28CF4A|nr:hypothetical protein [Nocardioides sp. cx-173]MCD4524968.1 hypothetical protein [Nocardioides sp. cx-173]UGB40323.1 hypothetical protein LQ940_13105 [Nocardioides sp. cx-173]
MTRLTWVRRLATLGAMAALPLVLAVGLIGPATGSAQGMAPAEAAGVSTEHAATQRVTLRAPACEGCRLRVYSAVFDEDGEPDVWTSKAKRVVDGRVSFRVPEGRTRGLSVSVAAPWEGRTNYVTHVAFRYRKAPVGEAVTVAQARRKQWASACWAGTEDRRTTLRVITRKVTVPGVHGPTAGTLAFVRTTQRAMAPMRRAHNGVLGSQDVNVCGRR